MTGSNETEADTMLRDAKRWERLARDLEDKGYVESAAALRAAAKLHRAKGLFGTPQDDMTERMTADD